MKINIIKYIFLDIIKEYDIYSENNINQVLDYLKQMLDNKLKEFNEYILLHSDYFKFEFKEFYNIYIFKTKYKIFDYKIYNNISDVKDFILKYYNENIEKIEISLEVDIENVINKKKF